MKSQQKGYFALVIIGIVLLAGYALWNPVPKNFEGYGFDSENETVNKGESLKALGFVYSAMMDTPSLKFVVWFIDYDNRWEKEAYINGSWTGNPHNVYEMDRGAAVLGDYVEVTVPSIPLSIPDIYCNHWLGLEVRAYYPFCEDETDAYCVRDGNDLYYRDPSAVVTQPFFYQCNVTVPPPVNTSCSKDEDCFVQVNNTLMPYFICVQSKCFEAQCFNDMQCGVDVCVKGRCKSKSLDYLGMIKKYWISLLIGGMIIGLVVVALTVRRKKR